MKQGLMRGVGLLLALAMAMSFVTAPVYADEAVGMSEPLEGQTLGESSGMEVSQSGQAPIGSSDTALVPEYPVIPGETMAEEPAEGKTEVLFTIPIGQSTGGEPVTGGVEDLGATPALVVYANYPNDKGILKAGDILTLLFKVNNYNNDAFIGTTVTDTGKSAQKGIGAFSIDLGYDFSAFELYGTPAFRFTTSTTPYATNNYNATAGSLKLVSLYSAYKSAVAQALNQTALNAAGGLIATVKLKLKALPPAKDTLTLNVDSRFAFVEDGGTVTEISATGGGPISSSIGYDTAAPAIRVADKQNEELDEDQRNEPQGIVAALKTVTPNAEFTISDDSKIASFSVKKGTANYPVTDGNDAENLVTFMLTDPATYTITATDAAGNTATGKVTVKPRITRISLALSGTTYIGDTFTVTPAVSPSISTLPLNDKALTWIVTWQDGTENDDFFTVNAQNPSTLDGYDRGTLPGGGYYVSWRQNSAAAVKFATVFNDPAVGAKRDYAIQAVSAVKNPDLSDRAQSNTLAVTSPVKVLGITMAPENKKTSLSSDPPETITVSGSITTQTKITPLPDPNDDIRAAFERCGVPIESIINTDVLRQDAFTISPATESKDKTGKIVYNYAYTSTYRTVEKARGVVDATLRCGDRTAVVTFNVTNYGTALTKMGITQTRSGLDFTDENNKDLLTISLADTKKTVTADVNPYHCDLFSSNTNLLTVQAISDEQAQVSVGEGARYLTAPTKVTVTAALKNDPQARKATAVYTVYPTDRHSEVVIDDAFCSDNIVLNVDVDGDPQSLSATSLPAEAQLHTLVSGSQLPNDGTEITSANKSLVKFSSSNTGIATVSDTGVITVKGYGECFITATATDGSGLFDRVRVISHKPIETILSSNAAETTVLPGAKLQFKLTGVLPADAASKANISKASWRIASCKQNNAPVTDQTAIDALLKIDAKGLLTVSQNAASVEATIIATVTDKAFNEDKTALVDAPRQIEFKIKTASGDAVNLKAFTKLTSPINLTPSSTQVVKVENALFTDYSNVVWSLGFGGTAQIATPFEAADGNVGIKLTAAAPGKATLYASYMGKTLSVPVTVYDDATQKAAVFKLNFASGAENYTVFDRYSTSTLALTSTYGAKTAPSSHTFSAGECVFTSSMPNLVKVDEDGRVTVDGQQAATTLTKDTAVTITATLKNDPFSRKATFKIVVTPKILPKEIAWVDLYNKDQALEDYKDNTAAIDLNTISDRVLNIVVCETLRNGEILYLAPEGARTLCSPSEGERYLSSGAEYTAALTGLSFATANTSVATIDAKGIVTLKGKSSATPINVTVSQGSGTYAKGTAIPPKALALTVTQPCTGITLNQKLFTLTEGNTRAVTLTLKATTTPAGLPVTWKSSDESIATVVNGKVTINANRVAAESNNPVIISASSGDVEATCEIYIDRAGMTVTAVKKLSSAEKILTIGTDYTLPFRSNADSTDAIHALSSNESVLEVSGKQVNTNYDLAPYTGYTLTLVPKKPGTSTVTLSVGGKTYSEAFTVYEYSNPSGSSLLLTQNSGTLLLDGINNGETAVDSQYFTVSLIGKDKKPLQADGHDIVIPGEEVQTKVQFTSSNPNLLVVRPDGHFYVRNLNTITKVTTVTVTAVLKGEARKGSYSFKITPQSAVSAVNIQQRERNSTYLMDEVTPAEHPGDPSYQFRAIYTDMGNPHAPKVFNLMATLSKNDGITVASADKNMVSWSSSDTKVATVSADGTVTAKGKGTATITCTAKDGSGIHDSIILRINYTPSIVKDIPRVIEEGISEPAVLTLPVKGKYTIPFSLSPTKGDYYISGYEVRVNGVPAASPAVTVDTKGNITAKAIPEAGQDISVAVKINRYNQYSYDSVAKTESTTGDIRSPENDIIIPIHIIAAPAVKSIALYNSATRKTVSTLDIGVSDVSALYFTVTDTAGKPIGDLSPAVISVEKQARVSNDLAAPGVEIDPTDAVAGRFELSGLTPGSYRLNIAMGGKTAAFTVNVYYRYNATTIAAPVYRPMTSSVKLAGSVVSAQTAGMVYKKVSAADFKEEDTRPRIRILPTTGACVSGDAYLGYAGSLCTYTSSSPLVRVDAEGNLTIAEYIPKETKVTITAKLKNDPAKRAVSIPITVTSQNLARTVTIKQGAGDVTDKTIEAIANKSTLRLTAQCQLYGGSAPADNLAVTWTSSNTKVATVDKTGKVTLVGTGNTVITATAADGGGALAKTTIHLKPNILS